MSAVFETRLGVRPMVEEDLEEIILIEEEVYESPWTEGIFYDCMRVGYSCWVYEDDSKIVAYAVLSVAANEAHVLTLVVHPDMQKKGIGRMMLEHMLIAAYSVKVDTVLLEVRPSNKGAIHLYLIAGFRTIGKRPDYYPSNHGREDALVMSLPMPETMPFL